MPKKPPSRRVLEAAARRRACIAEHGGTGVWRPRATRFKDRKKAKNRRACRGPLKQEGTE
jgi:hypothetical protein